MSSIRSVSRQTFQPQIKGGSAKIADLKMQIDKVRQKEQMGDITKEEADMQIASLEAKITRLESGDVGSVNNFETQDFTVPSEKTDGNCNNFDNPDSAARQDSYFEQQALYNKALHGLN